MDSWLREFLDTKASAQEIARELSLASVSVERVEQVDGDKIYDIEVTTNRPDLMSHIGIAKEAAAALSEQGIPAKFTPPQIPNPPQASISFPIEIKNDPKLVNRIMAVVIEVKIRESPKQIKERLEASGIRSLNNIVDVTNYVMREVGHPCHVFDFDLLGKQMIIRESRPGEIIKTLDGKEYRLLGKDIVADNGEGEIIDLLGVMGTANSVVQKTTKRILFFLDNNNPQKIRQTSMNLGIRSEAAIINEKGVDPQLLDVAFARGVELYQQIANGKVVSKTLDIYPNKPSKRTIKISLEKISSVVGLDLSPSKSIDILEKLGFGVKKTNNSLEVLVPTIRANEVLIDEDIIEEIARIYGYHKLPSVIPNFLTNKQATFVNNFYFEQKAKSALKYWGFTEVYTYSLISEDLYDGPIEKAVKLKNPLSVDMAYLRNSLIPSLLEVVDSNKTRDVVKIFELANTYHKRPNNLPEEKLTLAGVLKKIGVSFYEIKGLIETLFDELGIKNYKFRNRPEPGAEVLIGKENVGYIEILNQNLIDFELNFDAFLKSASNKKAYKPLAKFPPVFEDITFVLDEGVLTEDVREEISLQSFLIREVSLKDTFENARTFHVIYQAEDRNLNNADVSGIRDQIIKAVVEKFKASVK